MLQRAIFFKVKKLIVVFYSALRNFKVKLSIRTLSLLLIECDNFLDLIRKPVPQETEHDDQFDHDE